MSEYYLYLDESKPTDILPYFCLAGCIIEQNKIFADFSAKIDKLKNEIFPDPTTPLHEYDIRDAKKEKYKIFKRKEVREKFWTDFRTILTDSKFFTISAAIHCSEYKKTYKCCMMNNEYRITLQIVMENFAFFLAHKNATGKIYLEKTNDVEAQRLKDHFFAIRNTGTLYLSSDELKKRLIDIEFLTKSDNNAGLQLADFVPNAFHRKIAGLNPRMPSVLDIMETNIYDGGLGMVNRFGKRILLEKNP